MGYKSLRNSIPYLFIMGIAFFMFRRIFAPGFMSGYDNSFHYYDVYYLTNTLIPVYHWISGWCMQSLAGFPVLLDYYQIGHLLVAFMSKLPGCSLNLAYKSAVFMSYFVLGAGFYKVSSHRFGKIAALFITVSLMLQKDIYCDRILGGIWNNYLALGLFLVFFHILDKNTESLTVKKAVGLGLLLGLIILTHLYVAVFAFLLLFITGIFYITKERKGTSILKKSAIYMCIPFFAVLCSSYYLRGFIIAKDYFAPMSIKPMPIGIEWSFKSFFGPLQRVPTAIGTVMVNVPVIIRVIFSFFGVYAFLKTEKEPSKKRFLGYTLIFLLVSLILFSDILANVFSWWGKIAFVGNLQTNRFLIYAQLGMYLFAAYGLAQFIKLFRFRKLVITTCAVLILGSLFFHYGYFARDASETLSASPNMRYIFKTWKWIDDNIPAGDFRIVYQNTRGNTKDAILDRSDVFALSGIFTKVAQIGVARSASPFPQEKYMRTDYGHIFGDSLSSVDATHIKDMMNVFNARYIVSVERLLQNKLKTSELFLNEANFGPFSIFRLKDHQASWVRFKDNVRHKIVAWHNQSINIHIWNETADNEVFVNVAYHPLWRAVLNKKSMEIGSDEHNLMKIPLPKEGFYNLDLSFNSFPGVWVWISSFGFIIGLAVMLCAKDRKG